VTLSSRTGRMQNYAVSRRCLSGFSALRGPHMLWNIAVGLTILVAFGSVLFALWTDREPSEREGRAQLER
jgi:hypothetical protein